MIHFFTLDSEIKQTQKKFTFTIDRCVVDDQGEEPRENNICEEVVEEGVTLMMIQSCRLFIIQERVVMVSQT